MVVNEDLIKLMAKIADPDSWRPAQRRFPGQIAPTIQRAGYTRIPLPGYVGDAYERTRIVFLGTNPGPGKGRSNFRSEDVDLFKTFLPEFVQNPDSQNFKKLTGELVRVMPEWDIFRNIDFPYSFGLRMEEFAYSNVLLVNTPDGKGPGELEPRVFEHSIKKFLVPWLELLDPKLVVVFGKGAARHLETYWRTRSSDLKVVPMQLPTRQNMNTRRETFQTDLKQAKAAVAAVFPQAKRRQR